MNIFIIKVYVLSTTNQQYNIIINFRNINLCEADIITKVMKVFNPE